MNDSHLSTLQILERFEALHGELLPEEHHGKALNPVDTVTRHMFYFWKYSSMKFEERWKSGRVDLVLDTVVLAT